jgi:hypothetical protein
MIERAPRQGADGTKRLMDFDGRQQEDHDG